jgi:sugar (pentulose or hexulose) kinase
MSAFVGMGEYSSFSDAVKNMVHYKMQFEPRKEYTEIYKELFTQVYKKIYPAVRNLYDKIQKITKYPQY